MSTRTGSLFVDRFAGIDRPDHGFRIAPDGMSYMHGAGSTLERLVPAWLLVPKRGG